MPSSVHAGLFPFAGPALWVVYQRRRRRRRRDAFCWLSLSPRLGLGRDKRTHERTRFFLFFPSVCVCVCVGLCTVHSTVLGHFVLSRILVGIFPIFIIPSPLFSALSLSLLLLLLMMKIKARTSLVDAPGWMDPLAPVDSPFFQSRQMRPLLLTWAPHFFPFSQLLSAAPDPSYINGRGLSNDGPLGASE